MRHFKLGDTVRQSAKFLRSIDPNAAKGWPTTFDYGKGMVAHVEPCGDFELVTVWFWEPKFSRTYNSNNLIHDR